MNIFTLFGGLVPTPNGNTSPLPWQLIAHPKSGQISDIQCNISYMYMHRYIGAEIHTKSVHKSVKKRKWGQGGQAGAGG